LPSRALPRGAFRHGSCFARIDGAQRMQRRNVLGLHGKEPTMRLPTISPEYGNLVRASAVLAATLFGAGCSLLDEVSAPPTFNPSLYYVDAARPFRVSREYMNRYACPTDAAMICECVGRIGSVCDCHCGALTPAR
jgi:hypothetical protein